MKLGQVANVLFIRAIVRSPDSKKMSLMARCSGCYAGKANRLGPRTVCKRQYVSNGTGHVIHTLRSPLANAADAYYYEDKDLLI